MIASRVAVEVRALSRSPQTIFFSVVMPVGLIIVLGSREHGLAPGTTVRLQVLTVPGLVAFGLINTCYLTLAATLVTQREAGVLKRLRSTPLSPSVFLAGHLGSVLALSAAVTVTGVAVGAVLFGVTLSGMSAIAAFLVATAVGCLVWGSLALALTPAIRSAASAGPVAQATYLPLALTSGVFFPDGHRDGLLRVLGEVFPVGRFADAMQAPFAHPATPWRPADLAVLAAWGVGAALVARRWFRWVP